MVDLKDIKKISEFEWEIGRGYMQGMRVAVRIFGTQEIIRESLKDNSLQQAVNTAFLPGLHKYVCVMPDVHQGYGFPIGGVAASDYVDGVISPGGIGYDINCGIRLMASEIPLKTAQPVMGELVNLLFHNCPVGVGKSGAVRLSLRDFSQVCAQGSGWALKHGYASPADLETTEDGGCIEGADPGVLSNRAVERGLDQLGSLGSGNHFIEIDVVDEIFDQQAAQAMGLVQGCLSMQIHSGSRGFGHQVCTDYVKEFQSVVHKYRIQIPDRELVCAPISSPEGQRYLAAMRCAANYAFCNRQVLAHKARQVFVEVLEKISRKNHLWMVYDLAHNIGKIEDHIINGRQTRVCVHRKGATRAFGPSSADIPLKYARVGQPLLIPGSMGTASWVMVGTESGMQKSFGSCSHGAGRLLSRSAAKRIVRGEDLLVDLREQGVTIKAGSMAGLAEEAPMAYKDVDMVINSVVGAGLAKKVARLKPVAVIKG